MVSLLYGPTLSFLFNFFTFWSWNLTVDQKYVYANCYKVIACDPNDELVLESGSLKVGVSKFIISNESSRKVK